MDPALGASRLLVTALSPCSTSYITTTLMFSGSLYVGDRVATIRVQRSDQPLEMVIYFRLGFRDKGLFLKQNKVHFFNS